MNKQKIALIFNFRFSPWHRSGRLAADGTKTEISSMAKKKKNHFTRFFIAIALGANLCTILLLWLCVASTWVPPDAFPRIALLGLLFPFFVLANVAFLLFWLIFYFRLSWIPVVGILPISLYCLDYCPINAKPDNLDSTICIATLNAGGMRGVEMRNNLLHFIKETAPDILCMQEISSHWFERYDFSQAMDSLQYHRISYGSQTILSKYPFLGDTLQVSFPTRSNKSTACWIACGGDSVLLINNHLESNHLSETDKTAYKEMIKDPEKDRMEKGGRRLIGKLAHAVSYRGSQADTLCALSQKYKDKGQIICGDFNDTPISYTYQKMNRVLTSAFRESGKGLGISYNQRGFYVRIDHIFLSSQWQPVYTYVDRHVDASDHYPVVTYVRKRDK